MTARRLVAAVVASCLALVATVAGAAPAPAEDTWLTLPDGSPRHLGPDLERAFIFEVFCLTRPAAMTITVVDAEDQPVRHLETDTPHAAVCGSETGNATTWNARDDAGRLVADGSYALVLHADDQAGTLAEQRVLISVDRRIPGVLTGPAEGALLRGSFAWTFTPTDGFPVTGVSLGCASQTVGAADAPGPDGTFGGVSVTAPCDDGANFLEASVRWRDPFGSTQTWNAPAVHVTVDNPPTVAVFDGHRYFSPDDDPQDPTATLTYCSSDDARVAVTVTDAAGDLVRTVEAGTPVRGLPGCHARDVTTWDGRNDAGTVVPDGVYSVTVTATDAYGASAAATTDLGVLTRVPARLTRPSAGDHVAGSMPFTVAADLPLSAVELWCGDVRLDQHDAVAAGTDYAAVADVSGCPAGPTPVTVHATWIDPYDAEHFWESAPVVVRVSHPAVVSAPLQLATVPLPAAVLGRPYAARLRARGGLAPYTWRISAGRLPAGLRLSAATGRITGTPTRREQRTFAVTVTDADTPGAVVTRRMTLAVRP